MKLKSISEILSNLIDRTIINTHEINDFTVGSTIMSIYESIAMELEQYYVLGRDNILKGIEEGIYESFGFTRKPARRAYGEITIEFHTALKDDLYISRGNTFLSSLQGFNQTYESLEDYIIPAGQHVAFIDVYCTALGTTGNVPKGVINRSTNSLSNIKTVYNTDAFLTGQDQEELSKVKQRFSEFIATRGRATNKAISYGARTVEDVAGVYVREEVGRIQVFAHDKNGNLPELVKAKIENAIEDYRPSGIKLVVVPIEKKTIDINITVTLTDKTAKTELFRGEIATSIENYLNTMVVSDDLILSDVVQRIMNIDDYLIYDVEVTKPTKNLIIEDNQLIRAGKIEITLV